MGWIGNQATVELSQRRLITIPIIEYSGTGFVGGGAGGIERESMVGGLYGFAKGHFGGRAGAARWALQVVPLGWL